MRSITRLLLLLAATCSLPLVSSAALAPLTGAVAIEAGNNHACALMSNGGVQCWGANDAGQLGDGSLAVWRHANYVSGLSSGVVAIGTGAGHSCAVLAGGGVKCWGNNGVGELGNGTSGYSASIPVDVVGLGGPATAVALGLAHTCALLADKTVKCWGIPTAVGHGAAFPYGTPVAIPELAGVTAIAAGGYLSCALLETGAVKCWGNNEAGLGDGGTGFSAVAVDVAGLSSGVAALSAAGGYATSLAPSGTFACALTATGGVKCWGANFRGQLGDGSITIRPTPVDVSGLTSGVSRVSAGAGNHTAFQGLSATMGHACAVTSAGAVKCWGSNRCSQLGVAGGTCRSDDNQFAATPQDVPTMGSGVSEIAAGTFFTCTLMAADGAVNCWGDSTGGSVGTTWPVSLPPSPVLSGPMPQAIAFGPKPNVLVGTTGGILVAGGNSGNPVTLVNLTPAICSVSQPAPLHAGFVAASFTGHAQGTCRFTANQAGNAYYDPAMEVTLELNIKLSQTITFNSPAVLLLNTVANLDATASSGLPVTYFSYTPGTCTVSGNVVTGVHVGQCSIAALQAGDEGYAAAAQVTRSFPVALNAGGPPRMSNISSRIQVLTGDDVMIAGFVIGGGTNKTVAIVATGPSLGAFGVANALPNPVLTIVRSSDGVIIATNDDWQTDANAGQLEAMRFAPSRSLEAAILANLAPGAYTAIVQGSGGGTGVAVVGVYEVDATNNPLLNISTRGHVQTGDNVMIAGFVVEGTGPRTVAIVGTGPSLSGLGITNPLANPTLTLVRSSDQVAIDSNDDWQAHANASQLQAAGLAPANTLEAGIYVTLQPGAYTAILSGVGGATGVGVIGVYAVP